MVKLRMKRTPQRTPTYYKYVAIATSEIPDYELQPYVKGEFIILTIPVNDHGVPIQQAHAGRPGFGWTAYWRSGENAAAWQRIRGQRPVATEDEAHKAARGEIESIFNAKDGVFLFPTAP